MTGDPRSRRNVLLWTVLAVLLMTAGVTGFALSRHPAEQHEAAARPPAWTPPSSLPSTGPYAPGHSWRFGKPTAPPPGQSAVDLRGRRVQYDPGAVPEPGGLAVADTGLRFVVPSVGLNVPLGAISVAHGVVTPPGYRSVYLIRHKGVSLEDAGKGTVFAATHALRDGTAPGNYFIDVPHHRSRLRPGTHILVGNRVYHVTGARVIPKPSLAGTRSIWQSRPGRLVVITCFQLEPNRPAVRNLVITAEL